MGELGGAEWLGDQGGAEAPRFAQDPFLSFCGDDEHRELCRAALLAEVAEQIEPRAVGKMEIEQQSVGRRPGAQRAACFVERSREADAIAELLEQGTQYQPDVRLVIHNEEMSRRRGQRLSA